MHAVTFDEPGDPSVLHWREVADPQPGAGEVLVRVAAAGVNRADLLQRQGLYPPPPGASDILGLECAGTVVALGEGADTWRVGDEVCALLTGGGYAELVAVPEGQLLPCPGPLEQVEAAALPETVCTVWSNVFTLAGLQPGETLLVHGGGSGIGTTAIQLAKQHGARVAVTAGSAAKLARCLDLGADIAIDYREEDFVVRLREETEGQGADVILDNMGAKYLGRNVEALARLGRLVTIGLQGGAVAELNLALLLGKSASVHATSLRGRPVAEKAAIVAQVRERVWPWVEAGRVRPVVDRVLAMDDADEAHRVVAASEHVGKVVLETP